MKLQRDYKIYMDDLDVRKRTADVSKAITDKKSTLLAVSYNSKNNSFTFYTEFGKES